jgi:hypothetical protein
MRDNMGGSRFALLKSGNKLLDLIAAADAGATSAILEHARRIEFDGCRKLQRAGDPIESCYFPADGVLAMVWPVDVKTEVSTLGIGYDGAVNVGPGTELSRAPHHVGSHLPGTLFQVPAGFWQELLEQNSKVRNLVCRYADFLLGYAQKALACQMRHDVESRFCRWLLELHYWQRGKPLSITHQGLARLLGVRRTTVTLLAGSLQEAGIISYRRSSIEVVDAYALHQASCRCQDSDHPWASLAAREPQSDQAGEPRSWVPASS